MTWFDIFKKDKRIKNYRGEYYPSEPLPQIYTEIQLWLHKIFNVPLGELDKLNYPHDLVKRLRQKSNLEVIDEGKFTLLMELSEQGRYQELLDVLDNMLKTASQERRKTYHKLYYEERKK